MYAKHESRAIRRSLFEDLAMNPDQQETADRLVAALKRTLGVARPEVPGLVTMVPLAEDYLDPAGIHVVWIFETRASLNRALESGGARLLYQLTATALREARMQVESIDVNVHFDSEELCQQENQGNWQSRLSIRHYPAREVESAELNDSLEMS